MGKRGQHKHPLHVARIVAQLFFLGLFLFLLILTARGALATASPRLARLFLDTDPLVLAGAALAGVFSTGLLAALAVVALSLVAPRA
jgi:hypothetical protein